jgi:hypothetical protein
MTTTIKSTALDFDNIKNNLKTFLANKDEFADYNFEASGLSNVLDVLAYNTHYNGLIANFALNESFISTAQLRSSVVALAEGIGYVPDSKTSSVATVKLSTSLAGVSGRPSIVQIPSGFTFTATVDEIDYTFQTVENLTGTDDGFGYYEFLTADSSNIINIKEGQQKSKTFLITQQTENATYIIPDGNLDSSTAVVRVYESATSNSFSTFTNILNATTINEVSTLYILKEAPNGNYELSFGNGTTLGRAPEAGSKVVVSYLASNGQPANTAKVFEPSSQVTVAGVGYDMTVTTQGKSVGGGERESLESIRKNAPFQYASQNRMVTHPDYSTLVLRNFSTLIKDIKTFGGEDALEPEFGVVFMSVLFNDDVPVSTVNVTKQSISDLAEQLSVASFNLKFSDPITTFVESRTFFQFNPRLTTLSRNTIQDNAQSAIDGYFNTNTGLFGQSFRRSNMLTLVDAVSPAILSSRAEIFIQRRFTPLLTRIQDHTLRYPVGIAAPDDENYRIVSTAFSYKSQTCIIRNKLSSNKLEVYDQGNNIVIIDNVGDYSGDTVSIVGLQIDGVIGGGDVIKLSVKPANESAISPLRQDILEYDASQSFTRVVDIDTGITN